MKVVVVQEIRWEGEIESDLINEAIEEGEAATPEEAVRLLLRELPCDELGLDATEDDTEIVEMAL